MDHKAVLQFRLLIELKSQGSLFGTARPPPLRTRLSRYCLPNAFKCVIDLLVSVEHIFHRLAVIGRLLCQSTNSFQVSYLTYTR